MKPRLPVKRQLRMGSALRMVRMGAYGVRMGSALAIVDSVLQTAGWRNQEDKKVNLAPIANDYFQS